jgi:hypothetical protein
MGLAPPAWWDGGPQACLPVGEPATLGQALARMSSAGRLRRPAPPLLRASACPSLTGGRHGWRDAFEHPGTTLEQGDGRSAPRRKGAAGAARRGAGAPVGLPSQRGGVMGSVPSPGYWVCMPRACLPVGEPARLGQALARMSSAGRLRRPAPPLLRASACPSLTGSGSSAHATDEYPDTPQEQGDGHSAPRRKGGADGPRPSRGTAAEPSARRPAPANPAASFPPPGHTLPRSMAGATVRSPLITTDTPDTKP